MFQCTGQSYGSSGSQTTVCETVVGYVGSDHLTNLRIIWLYNMQTLKDELKWKRCAFHTTECWVLMYREKLNYYTTAMYTLQEQFVINPRRACVARVTVLGLCVCV